MTIKRLLQYDNINVNIRDINGQTPLFYAVWYGFEDAALTILSRNHTDVHVFDDAGDDIMLYACQNGMISVVKRLLQIDPTLIHTRNLEDGATALHLAVDFREVQFRNDSGAVKVLEYLYESKDSLLKHIIQLLPTQENINV